MAISCQPNDLADAAKCFAGIPPVQQTAIQIALLCAIAGGTTLNCDQTSLASAAKCFVGFSPIQQNAIIIYLLCQIASGAGSSGTFLSGSGSPVGVVTPTVIGQTYLDTTTPGFWMANGLTSANWTQIA